MLARYYEPFAGLLEMSGQQESDEQTRYAQVVANHLGCNRGVVPAQTQNTMPKIPDQRGDKLRHQAITFDAMGAKGANQVCKEINLGLFDANSEKRLIVSRLSFNR